MLVNKYKVIVAVPSLSWDGDMIYALLRLLRENLDLDFVNVRDGLLPQARNCAVKEAYANCPDFTHILFIDTDMVGFDSASLSKLISADKPIISGLITMRKPPFTVASVFREQFDIVKAMNEEWIVPTHYVGAAFTLIKREVFDRTRESTPEGDVWFTLDREPRVTIAKETDEFIKHIQTLNKSVTEMLMMAVGFGMSVHLGSRLVGEDYNFCQRARMVGYENYVHCGVVVGHMGTKAFSMIDAIRHMEENKNEEPILRLHRPIVADTDGLSSGLQH